MVFQPTTTGDVPTVSFSLAQMNQILKELLGGRDMSIWSSQQNTRAQAIKLYRDYYDGIHPAYMTDEMRNMLRAQRPGTAFNDNFMPVIVDAEADRLVLDTIQAVQDEDEGSKPASSAPSASTQPIPQATTITPTPNVITPPTASNGVHMDPNSGPLPYITPAAPKPISPSDTTKKTDDADKWVEDILADSDSDALQADVHESMLRDGDAYVMVAWNKEKNRPILKHELAFDTRSGVVMIYDSADSEKVLGALKIWHIADEAGLGLATRINVYLPDRIMKYIALSGGDPRPIPGDANELSDWDVNLMEENEWNDQLKGEPVGIPVVHFRNRGRHNYGQSELRDCIPLQDILNRIMYSMVISSELASFGIRIARGFQPPSDLTPGMWITISKDTPLEPGQTADATMLQGAPIQPYLDSANWVIEQIHRISRTPNPEFFGADAGSSGEALKQRESTFIGKCRKAQVKAGAAWEQCMNIACNLQNAFGNSPAPKVDRWNAVWQDAEIRNDQTLVQNALAVADKVDDETFLRIVAKVFDWSESDINNILSRKQADAQVKMQAQIGATAAMKPNNPASSTTNAVPQAPTKNAPPTTPTTPGQTNQKPQNGSPGRVVPIADEELHAVAGLHRKMVPA